MFISSERMVRLGPPKARDYRFLATGKRPRDKIFSLYLFIYFIFVLLFYFHLIFLPTCNDIAVSIISPLSRFKFFFFLFCLVLLGGVFKLSFSGPINQWDPS